MSQYENALTIGIGVFIALVILPYIAPLAVWITSKGNVFTAFAVSLGVMAAWLSACRLAELMRR